VKSLRSFTSERWKPPSSVAMTATVVAIGQDEHADLRSLHRDRSVRSDISQRPLKDANTLTSLSRGTAKVRSWCKRWVSPH
jgi:hypothetical protein